MTIRQQGGVFGRNPTFNIATADELKATTSLTTPLVNSDTDLLLTAANKEGLKVSATNGFVGINAPVTYKNLTMGTTGISQPVTIQMRARNGSGGDSPVGEFATEYDAPGGANGSKLVMRTRDGGGLNDGITLRYNSNVEINRGNLVMANGQGIDFSATAGTGTSELFDDYEEGTWTPTVAGDATGVLSSAEGVYVKIGQMVFVQCGFTVGTNFTSNKIGGLPFTVGNYLSFSAFMTGNAVLVQSADVVMVSGFEGSTDLSFFNDNNSASFHPPNTTNAVYRLNLSYRA